MWSKAKNGLVQPRESGRTSPFNISWKREILRGCVRKIKVSDKTYELLFARDVRLKWWKWVLSAQMIGVAGQNQEVLRLLNLERNKGNPNSFGLPVFGLSDKTWTCGLYHPNGVRLLCKSANIVEYLPISLIFRGFRLLFGKYRLPKKCTRYRKNIVLYQNLVPDFSVLQGFCALCHKELYHIFVQKSSTESYLFEN